jgi:hypothetical protein
MRKKVVRAISLGIIALFVGMSLSSGQSMIYRNKQQVGTLQTVIFNPTDDRSTGNANVEYMEVRNGSYQGHNYEWVSLVKFDISSIPSDATITSASLNLYYWQWRDNNPAGRILNLTRVITDWNEETLEWYNQPNYADQRTSYSIVPTSTGCWMEWDVTKDIQSFFNGTLNNYGWKVGDENFWEYADIPVTSFRTKENNSDKPFLEVKINLPPEAPTIKGPTSGDYREAHQWNFTATDPDSDNIFYYVDWGDGTNTGWSLVYHSSETMPKSHQYAAKGTYTIQAKAKDIYNKESDWGTLTVTMPCSYNIPLINFWDRLLERFPNAFPILQHLLGY